MKIKKFEAPSMKEALEKIKQEMGPDAFILGTKSIKKKGPLGFGDRNFLQVTAAVEEDAIASIGPGSAPAPSIDIRQDSETGFESRGDAKPRPPAVKPEEIPKNEPDPDSIFPKVPTYTAGGNTVLPDDSLFDADPLGRDGFSQGFDAIYGAAIKTASPKRDKKRSEGERDGRPLRKEINEIKSMVADLGEKDTDLSPLQKELQEMKGLLYSVIRNQSPIAGIKLSPAMITIYQWMKDTGVDENIAAKMIKMAHERMKDEHKDNVKRVKAYLKTLFAGLVDVARPELVSEGRPRVVALVGPTGVGKTTTVAKLAAYAHLQAGAEVVLITLDTYRIAAVEQLKTYAKIMEIPVQVALNTNELRQAIQFHQDKSLVLIDTAGHSQRDEIGMANLRNFFDDQSDIEVHLVLSATTKSADLADIINRFDPLNPEYLIFTKLDETSAYGSLFTQIVKTKKPVSFVTTGQNVPEDFEFASRPLLAGLFAGQGLEAARGGVV